MAINFNSLPQDRPAGSLIEKGKYKIKIEKAEMKVSKTNPSNPPYLNLIIDVSDAAGNNLGKVYDIITESDNDYVRYKLKRFIETLGIPITANMSLELKDLAKIAQGKEMMADITIDTKSEPNKSVIDIFSGEIYYPLDIPTNAPINAPDAADAETADPAPAQGVSY